MSSPIRNAASPALSPGFVWLSWGSVLIGIVYSVIYGWYIAATFTVFHSWFDQRLVRKN